MAGGDGGHADAYGLRDVERSSKDLRLGERIAAAAEQVKRIRDPDHPILMRHLISSDGREVVMLDRATGQPRAYLMFGSNNYLGLANHPHVIEQSKKALDQYGAGI